ncbi:helix-turn-helix domain-containing protein [Actinocorallia sp. A-T 12471]|uniref:TetR/AcrR family transcriptional regulator n=1 Tax=Actinocorallia sp. A-T 12471 TaxID=3089813 RepID=UPI0029D30C26|nr:helix-turn-helix domain-containing protein [Actinocorallia sp. A-T 12471]MDX6740716.1 helix-turn-helix domain-containing protein [Actinocorallia sp. A-T 12471]
MARWDPGAEQRLRGAALELFGEHGYEAVTVTQIAERAGLTRRSFFRYFPDKREVLFAHSDRLPPAFAEAVAAVDAAEPPLAAALTAVSSVGERLVDLVSDAAPRRAVIAASAELRERERTKLASVAEAIQQALEARGTEPTAARLTAHLATLAFREAFDHWIDANGKEPFPTCLAATVTTLQSCITQPHPTP